MPRLRMSNVYLWLALPRLALPCLALPCLTLLYLTLPCPGRRTLLAMGSLSASDRSRALSFQDWIVFLWLIIDAITHLTIEALYLFFALGPVLGYGPNARDSGPESALAFIWQEYGKADRRW